MRMTRAVGVVINDTNGRKLTRITCAFASYTTVNEQDCSVLRDQRYVFRPNRRPVLTS